MVDLLSISMIDNEYRLVYWNGNDQSQMEFKDIVPVKAHVDKLYLEDMNNDTHKDIIYTDKYKIFIAYQNEAGNFSSTERLLLGNCINESSYCGATLSDLEIADLNGDGVKDILVIGKYYDGTFLCSR